MFSLGFMSFICLRFAPKLPLSGTDICLTKAKKKRAVLLELLVPDLVAKDPLVSVQHPSYPFRDSSGEQHLIIVASCM